MPNLWRDLRYAARVLLRSPWFTVVAVAVLAIGIGANSAIFSLVDAALLRPLPFDHAGQLAMLWERPPSMGRNRVAPLNYLDWSEQNKVFESMAAVFGGSRTMTTPGGSAERVPGQMATFAFFHVLRVRPILGRTFTKEDDRLDANVVVLSERFWRSRFSGDPKIIGRAITLDGQPCTVIGVVPADFQVLYAADLWTPFSVSRNPVQRRMHYMQVIARQKPGIDLDEARAGMSVVAEDIARISPDTNKGWGVTAEPLHDAVVGRELRTTSLILAGVVGFVLLMACANVANLMLTRAAGRSREIAVRSSLGGSRARIVQQLLTESVLLAAMGGCAGIALAWTIVRAAPAMLPVGTLPAGVAMTLDIRVMAFTAAVSLATGLLFGFAPAWQAARLPLAEALRSGSRSETGRMGILRSALAVSEIAVAVILVAGAGLFLRTLGSLEEVDPGYHAKNVLTAYVVLPIGQYRTPARMNTFYQAAEREISAVPGVRSMAFGGSLPLDGFNIGQGFQIVGEPAAPKANQPSAHYQIVGTKYFETLGIPLLRGRAFDQKDNSGAPQVCIVNEEFVRRYAKGKDPVGMHVSVQSMAMSGPEPVVREVVGVVGQVKVNDPGEPTNLVEIYVPIHQNPWFSASLVVQTASNPLALVPAVKAAIARVDKDLPLARVRTMEEIAADSIARPKFRAGLIASFAGIALGLAAIGIFGVLAFSVSQRTREFGIRMALGAKPADLVRMVARWGVKIAAVGIVTGLAGAAAVTRLTASLLFGVKPLDPVTFIAAPALLAAVALAACAIPAIRATRVDPAVALRQE